MMKIFGAQKRFKYLAIIFFSSVFSKIALGFWLNPYHAFERFEYEAIAQNILAGKGFVYNFCGADYRAFIQPLYPVFIWLVYSLTHGNQMALMILQAIISSASCLAVYYIGRRITGYKQSLLAAALVAFHPGLFIYSIGKLHTLVMDTFLYLLSIVVFFWFKDFPNAKRAACMGAVWGVTLLSRMTILPFFVFLLAFFLIVSQKKYLAIRWRYIAMVILSATIAYSPWVIRNYFLFNRLVVMQTCSGENLWAGNNELASGTAMVRRGVSIHEIKPQAMRQRLEGLSELEQVEYYDSCFRSFLREHPGQFAKLFSKKMFYFWWFSPQTGALYSKTWLRVYVFYYSIILFCFVVGVVAASKERRNLFSLTLLLIYMGSISLVHAVVNIDTRHRWTVEPVMLVFSAIGIYTIAVFLRGKLRRC